MLKNINKVICIGATTVVCLFLIISCQEDESANQYEAKGEKSVQIMSLADFASKVNIDETFNRLNQYFDVNASNNSYSRIDDNSEFTVLTNEIVSIERDAFTTYTFKVDMVTEDDIFYNLVLKVSPENQIISSKFHEYHPSEEWLFDTEQNFTGLVYIIDNDFFDDSNVFASRSDLNCTYTTFNWVCNFGNNHDPAVAEGNPNYDCTSWFPVYEFTSVPCGNGGGTPDGNGVPINQDTYTGGGGDTNNNPNSNDTPDLETDTVIIQGPTTDQKNCQKLSALGNNADIRAALTDLHYKAINTTNKREFGYKLENDSAPEELELANGNSNTLKVEFGSTIYANLHTHQDKDHSGNKAYPMFSVQDIFTFMHTSSTYDSGQRPKDFSNNTLTLTVQKGSSSISETYALKVNDWTKLRPFYLKYRQIMVGSNATARIRRIRQYLSREYEKVSNNSTSLSYLPGLLKFMADNGIAGFDIYKAKNMNFNDWEKINYTLDNNNKVTINPSTDCNN